MTDKKTIIRYLKEHYLFTDCDPVVLDQCASQGSLQFMPKNKIICMHDEAADRFFIILSGWITLFRETINGTQAVISTLTKNDILGDAALFNEYIHPYSAEVSEDAQIISIPLSLIRSEMIKNAQFAVKMANLIARHRSIQDQEIEHRTLQTATQRIGCFILQLIQNKNNQNETSVKLPFDKSLIAAKLGMQPETFSRALNRLKSETDIQINGSTIEIPNQKKLVDHACGACSHEFPCQQH